MENYKLIPMLEIKDDVRKLAVAWGEKLGYDWIGDKHKLASDIQNLINKTGVKDKNGKEVFGGDIVKWKCGIHSGVSRVSFENGAFRLIDYFEPEHNNITQNWMQKYSEIIGNVYENPELLNIGA